MIILETKYISDTEGTLVYMEGQCMIQNMLFDDTTLEEIIVPLIHKDDSEMAIILDDTLSQLLKSFKIVHFDDTHAHFGEISYVYEKGEVLTWGTRLPKKIGIMEIPKVLPDGHVTLKISGDRLIIDDTLETKIFYKFENFEETLDVNMNLLKKVFEKHSNESFMLYLESEFPIGIEFTGPMKVRYYVAPLAI